MLQSSSDGKQRSIFRRGALGIQAGPVGKLSATQVSRLLPGSSEFVHRPRRELSPPVCTKAFLFACLATAGRSPAAPPKAGLPFSFSFESEHF